MSYIYCQIQKQNINIVHPLLTSLHLFYFTYFLFPYVFFLKIIWYFLDTLDSILICFKIRI